MRRPSIPYSAIPFPRARAERVNEVLSPAQERSYMILDPRDPPSDFEDDEDEFEDEEEDEGDEADDFLSQDEKDAADGIE